MANNLKEKTLDELLDSIDGIERSLDAATDAQELFFQSAVEQWETVNYHLASIISIAQQSNLRIIGEIDERVKRMEEVEGLTHPHELIRQLKADQISDDKRVAQKCSDDI